MVGALEAAKDLHEGQKCVVLMPDGIRNYMSKFVDEIWMTNKFLENPENTENHWWWDYKISDMEFKSPLIVSHDLTCQKILERLQQENIDYLSIVNEENFNRGVASVSLIKEKLDCGDLKPNDSMEKIMMQNFPKIEMNSTIGRLSKVLKDSPFAVVISVQEDCEY